MFFDRNGGGVFRFCHFPQYLLHLSVNNGTQTLYRLKRHDWNIPDTTVPINGNLNTKRKKEKFRQTDWFFDDKRRMLHSKTGSSTGSR